MKPGIPCIKQLDMEPKKEAKNPDFQAGGGLLATPAEIRVCSAGREGGDGPCRKPVP